MRKRWLFLTAIFVFFLCPLAAETGSPAPSSGNGKQCMIAGYSFTITGKTTEEALRSQIVPSGDEIFPRRRRCGVFWTRKSRS